MSPHDFPTNFHWGLIWLGLVIVASIGYRLSRGKPVLFFSVPNAQFIERTASGRYEGVWWRAMGGANNCLVVAIADGRLIVRPLFPFTLLFIPELTGFELDLPLDRVSLVAMERSFFRTWVRVAYLTPDGDRRKLSLSLRQPEDFSRLLPAKAA